MSKLTDFVKDLVVDKVISQSQADIFITWEKSQWRESYYKHHEKRLKLRKKYYNKSK